MTLAKTFFSKITDEYGGVYPEAFVAVRHWAKSSIESGDSLDCKSEYIVDFDVHNIGYKVNYWYTEQTCSDGKRSRPLVHEVDGEFTDEFFVDLEDEEVRQILDSAMSPIDKTLHAIQADVIRRYR